jgi:hypothetical protein
MHFLENKSVLNGSSATLIICVFMLIGSHAVNAQKKQLVQGSYTLQLGRSQTMEELESQCIEQAKLMAIAREFGTSISETTVSSSTDVNGKADNQFTVLTRTSVKGEWLQDETSPKLTWECHENSMQVTAQVYGYVREFPKSGKTEISFYACSAGDPTRAKTEFNHGESLQAFFKSSSNGYLSIYYIDHNKHTAQRLFPAATMASANHIAVQADKEFIVFNRNMAVNYGWGQATMEIALELPQGITTTIDELVAVFSTEEYTKPSLQTNEALAELSEEAFETWLMELKSRQKHCSTKRESISIGKK